MLRSISTTFQPLLYLFHRMYHLKYCDNKEKLISLTKDYITNEIISNNPDRTVDIIINSIAGDCR